MSVRESLSGTLVPSSVTTVALRPPEDKEKGTLKRKILDEEEYIEVRRNKMGVKALCFTVTNTVNKYLLFCPLLILSRTQTFLA